VRVTAFSLVLGIGAGAGWALDKIVQRNGEEAQGRVMSADRNEVVLRSGTVPKKIPTNQIVRVEWDKASKLTVAIRYEEQGAYQKAVEAYKEFLSDATGVSDLARQDAQFLIARASYKLAGEDAAQRKEAIQLIDAFIKENGESYRYYEAVELLGNAYLATKDYAKATSTFTLLEQAPHADLKMAALAAKAQVKFDQGDVSGAKTQFDAVVAMPAKTDVELSRKYRAMLGSARCQIHEKDYGAAIKALDSVTSEAPVSDNQLQAEAYLRLGDSLRAVDRTKDAALAYLHVDILFSAYKPQHAESLYRLVEMWELLGDTRREAEARAALESKYPESKWTKRLTQSGGAG
jgi:tetratricopeptide (TPR) repeat protein